MRNSRCDATRRPRIPSSGLATRLPASPIEARRTHLESDEAGPFGDCARMFLLMISEQDRPITFAGGTLDRYRHVCAFFDSFDEELRVLGPFVSEGLAHGHKAFHIVDPA